MVSFIQTNSFAYYNFWHENILFTITTKNVLCLLSYHNFVPWPCSMLFAVCTEFIPGPQTLSRNEICIKTLPLAINHHPKASIEIHAGKLGLKSIFFTFDANPGYFWAIYAINKDSIESCLIQLINFIIYALPAPFQKFKTQWPKWKDWPTFLAASAHVGIGSFGARFLGLLPVYVASFFSSSSILVLLIENWRV